MGLPKVQQLVALVPRRDQTICRLLLKEEVILHSGKHGILFICSNVSEFQLNSKWPYFFHKMVNFLSLNIFFHIQLLIKCILFLLTFYTAFQLVLECPIGFQAAKMEELKNDCSYTVNAILLLSWSISSWKSRPQSHLYHLTSTLL